MHCTTINLWLLRVGSVREYVSCRFIQMFEKSK